MTVKFVYSASLFLVTCVCSCSGDKTLKTNLGNTTKKVTYALLPEDIYRNTAIDTAVKYADQAQKNESRKLFMKGLDLLVNKGSPGESIDYFKEAIYYYPDGKNYTHLFQAYLKSANSNLADSVNNILATKIDYSEMNFNSALISSLRRDTNSCIGYLEEACASGFAFKDRIVEEPLFAFLKDQPSYQGLILNYFGEDEQIRKTLFKALVKKFPDLALPFEIPVDSVMNVNFDAYIDYDFSEFFPGMDEGRFSRDVSKEYLAVGKLKLKNGIGLLYKTCDVIADTLNPVYTNLLVYDTLGTLMSNLPLSCFCSPLESKDLFISKDFNIEVKGYTTVWEFDPLEKGYAGNRVVSRNQSTSLNYFISEGNKIETRKTSIEVASSGR